MKVKNQVTVGEVCSWKDCSFSKEGVDFPKRVTPSAFVSSAARVMKLAARVTVPGQNSANLR